MLQLVFLWRSRHSWYCKDAIPTEYQSYSCNVFWKNYPQFVLKAFKVGADGVFVAGCHMGDCHYDAGNYKLDRRMRLIYKLVEDMGIGKERVHHDWISASEGEKFSQSVKMMVNRIKELGPAPLKEQLDAER